MEAGSQRGCSAMTSPGRRRATLQTTMAKTWSRSSSGSAYEGAEDIDANLAENIARKATYKWVPKADGQCPLSVCSGSFHTSASVVFSTCNTR